MVADIINFLSHSGTIIALVGYTFALWVALTVWTWFDIASRTKNIFYRLGAAVLVALGFLLGFVIYLVLRPAQTRDEIEFRFLEEKIFESQSKQALCYNCGSVVEPEFSYCATCGVEVKQICANCDRKINHTWKICPYCSHPQDGVDKTKLEVEEASPNGSRFTILGILKSFKLPRIMMPVGGKKRGRPRKERIEVAKRPRGRPRKEINQTTTEA